MFALKLIILAASFYGPVRTAELAWAFGDAGLGIMVWLNVIAILILAKPALIALKDYETQKKAGVDPVFDPKALGIKNADFGSMNTPETRKTFHEEKCPEIN